MIRFQSRKIDFPKYGYFALVWLKFKLDNDVREYAFQLEELHYSETEAILAAKKFLKEPNVINNSNKEVIMLCKFKFFDSVPLLKRFWENSKTVKKYSTWKKVYLTIRLSFNDPTIYKVLVVPRGKNKRGSEKLVAAYSFKSARDPEIKKFMLGSGTYVDPTADKAALYERVDTDGLNLKTNQKIKNGVSFWEN